MAEFEFISNEAFRASLKSDYTELGKCIEAGAWKAAHVLAGSIVEAILVDYLLTTDFTARSGEDPLKFDLGRLIATCRSEKIVSERVKDLSSVIRQYRNLIHPGNSVRTGETVDSNSAIIAKSLVTLITNEITAKRQEVYGFTSEQIVAKVISDPSNIVVLTHLLQTTKAQEISKLLLKTILEEYRIRKVDPDSLNDINIHWLPALVECFRLAFGFASGEARRAVATEFVRVLRNEGEGVIQTYEELFVTSELDYLPKEGVALVKAHFLAKMERNLTPTLLHATAGLEKYIDSSEVNSFIDPLIKAISYGKDRLVRHFATARLEQIFLRTPSGNDDAWKKRLDEWIEHLRDQGKQEQAEALSDLKSRAEGPDVPF